MKYHSIIKIFIIVVFNMVVCAAFAPKPKRTMGTNIAKGSLNYRVFEPSEIQDRHGAKEFSNTFIMKYVGMEENAKTLGEEFGYTFVRKVLDDYVFKKDDVPVRSFYKTRVTFDAMKRKDNNIISFTQETYQKISKYETMETEYNITDEWWPKQWYLHPDHVPSMQVHEAWMDGFTGKGVTLVFVDDGVDTTHPDLVDNFDFSMSHNYKHNIANGSHLVPEDGHGTKTAGITMAVKNSECIVGIAHEARFTAVRLLDDELISTASQLVSTLTHRLDVIDIYSNSWGFPGYGSGFQPHDPTVLDAFERAANEGRNGKGAIYVMATGNDGLYGDDCNTEANIVSIYTIGVNSLIANGSLASYGETCTSVLVAAYGGAVEFINNTGKIVTTSRDGQCTDDFIGTSAACPVVSGVIALALEANPDLTWRDIQHLIVETSTTDNLSPDLDFNLNGAGKLVSNKVGFGLINAYGMVQAAKTWKTAPKQIQCTHEIPYVGACCVGPLIERFEYGNCHINHLEHVEVFIYFEASYREFVELHLISPSGTDSKLLRQRRLDFSSEEVYYTFMTVHNWGENPYGNWTIRLDNFYKCYNEMMIYSLAVTWYGTITDVKDGQPADGTLGGFCNETTTCAAGTSCRLQLNLCVPCNFTDEMTVNNICMKAGDIGAFCDVNTNCTLENSACNYDNNTCILCEDNSRNIDGVCMEDGVFGGYCDYYTRCTGKDIGCYEQRCVDCSAGYTHYDYICIKDGTLYGYCDVNTPCTDHYTSACLLEQNTCINCYQWSNYMNVNGICIEDGKLGGMCNVYTPCTESRVGCDATTGRCVKCKGNNRVINTYCVQDAVLFGYCDATLLCQDDSVCDLTINECVECDDTGYSIINGICVRDGVLGGYCDQDTPCIQPLSSCLQNQTTCVYCTGDYVEQNGDCIFKSNDETAASAESDVTQTVVVGITAFVSTAVVSGGVLFVVFKKFLAPKLNISNPAHTSNGKCNGVETDGHSRTVTDDVEVGEQNADKNTPNGTAEI